MTIEPITSTVSGIGASAITFLPNIAIAIILLLIGWLVGWAVVRIAKKVLTWVKIDSYISGENGKPPFSLVKILPVVISWGIYLIFIQAAVDALGIATLVGVVGAILGFLPGLIGAILVIVAGYALGDYVRRQIEESKIMYSGLIGKSVFFLVLYIAIATALPLVNIDATLINNILLVIIASAGAGAAIAIGLGLKEEVADVAKNYRKTAVKAKKK